MRTPQVGDTVHYWYIGRRPEWDRDDPDAEAPERPFLSMPGAVTAVNADGSVDLDHTPDEHVVERKSVRPGVFGSESPEPGRWSWEASE